MESEYIAMSRAFKMLIRINALKEKLLKDESKPTLMCDNKSAIIAAACGNVEVIDAPNQVRF